MASDSHPTPDETVGRMMMLLNGHLLEQALHVAAVLGVADLLADGPRATNALADATGSNAAALLRVLRVLASLGVFIEMDEAVFALTPMGEMLRSDSANSVRDRAIFYGSPQMWPVWGRAAPMGPRHVGLHPGFIDKNQNAWDQACPGAFASAGGGEPRRHDPVRWRAGFFLKLSPARLTKCQTP
jgi:hypothetical protein